MILIGLNKNLMSICKYCYQIELNYIRKNTDGLSLCHIFSEMFGSIFLFLSLVLKMFMEEGRFTFKNMKYPKFLLGVINFSFPILILFQIYIYRHNTIRYQKRKQKQLNNDLNENIKKAKINENDSEVYLNQDF